MKWVLSLFNLAFGRDAEVARFVEQNIENPGMGFDNFKAIGVNDRGRIVAGVVYHNWVPEAGVIEMSAASSTPMWLMGPVLHGIFAYPFEQLECQMVVLRVSAKNKRMCAIANRFGFAAYEIPRLRGRNENEIIFTLTVENWRQTPQEIKRNGQR